ncbi:insoluble matrix shell protein 6-like [Mercenaria mercenaria]|uniref:insoluble matrix shell protein 6-like n=1 Tax=Mercenaria mercenaria TaxID=6596 RepID=UPI00234E88B1|nr:insoluble matrix shell protein 6-like [Mercenaria mercenaria]
MYSAVILLAFFATVHCMYYVPQKPNFDCDYFCKSRGNKPVCSEKNQEFKNECYLECKWEYKECDGKCPCMVKVQREAYCLCPKAKDYVCTYGGETVDNQCIADCQNKPVAHKGRCPEFYK